MSFIPIPCPPVTGGGAEFDVEEVYYLCDVLAGEIVGTAVAVFTYDETTGAPVGPPTYVDPITGVAYVPQGTLQPCPSGSTAEFILCDIQTDNSAVQFIRKLIQSPTGLVLEVQDQTLDGVIYTPTGTVTSCDPYSACTPDSNLDLNADCGPGEAVDQVIVNADSTHPLANSVFVDDPGFDPLCGGPVTIPAAALPPGFPVDETFRNTTFDQPGPVTQANWPGGPFLTAGPPTNDGNGSGWIRLSDGSYASGGVWQVPTPFSTAQGMNAAVTLASHDGTNPGGDGQYFVFSDGSAPTQTTVVGGFGNLGLNNIDGGVFAVVLDEYGQSCTCDHTAAPVQSPNPGPCGFCSNTISIQIAGGGRVAATCACCAVAQVTVAPKAINQTTRAQPLRLLTSVITEAGQTYISASIDWNDGNGPIQYFDRVNVTACIPVPPTLRMGLVMNSGGAFQAVKEARDATARPAGESHWRAFPITTDPILPCVTLINLTGSVDVTFNSDTQPSGNGDPEAYFWLVNEATATVVARAEKSSIPSQVGTPTTLTWNAAVTPADLPNLRVYFGDEARDQNGEYDTTWDNFTLEATGAGCPTAAQRTLAISAPCPIPVTIVGGGSGDGGGGGTTVVNTPSTFEDALVCIENPVGVFSTGFRREVHQADGTNTVTFIDGSGLTVLPAGPVRPGPCPTNGIDTQKVCDTASATSLIARYIFDANGAITNTSYYALDGTGPVVPVGPLSEGGCCDPINMGEVCYFDGPDVKRAVIIRQCDPNNAPAFFTYAYDIETGIFLGGVGTLAITDCPSSSFDFEEEILCDNNGPFIRRYTYVNGVVDATTNFDLAGAPYVPVGPVVVCPTNVVITPEFDVEIVTLCDDNGGFFRRFTYDETTGLPTTVVTTDFAGAPYVPVGTVKVCDQSVTVTHVDAEIQFMCDNGTTTFLRRYLFNEDTGAFTSFIDLTLAGAAYVPAGPVTAGSCTGASAARFDQELLVLCDDNGSFVRRMTYDEQTQAQTVTNQTLAGAAYVPVGTVHICNDPAFSVAEEVLCDDNGSFIRRFIFNDVTGTLVSTTNFTLAGGAYVPVGTVASCETKCAAPNSMAIVSNCANVGSSQFPLGPNLLTNGGLEQSSGVGAASSIGPGWKTDYVPCGPNIFAGPCGGGTYAFFTTNSGQVTGGGTSFPTIGTRSMAVNVSNVLTSRIMYWENIYLENGKTYTFEGDAGCINAPFAIDVRVDGVVLTPMTAPAACGTNVWEHTTTTFVWSGTTGYHVVSLNSSSGVLAGNDHVLDNFSLRKQSPAVASTTTVVPYGCTVKAAIDQIVQTAGCRDDRRDGLLSQIADSANTLAATTVAISLDSTIQRQTGAGSITIPAGAKSITLSVLGTATAPTTINLGQGVTSVPAGVSLTWGVDSPTQSLGEAFTFTGVAGSDFIVHSISQ